MVGQIIGLLVCFGVYVILIFVFATIYYYLLFKSQRTVKPQRKHFIFQEEILLGRKEEIENRISYLQPEIEVLKHIVNELEQGKDIEQVTAENKSTNLPSGYKYHISKWIDYDSSFIQPAVVTEFTYIDLCIQNSLGHIIRRMVFENPSYDKFKENLLYRKKELAHCQQRLEGIGDYSPDIWSYWDFFYFSASTQTTLGYGDILPNSTLARILVIIQVFFGLAILVVLINFVILLFQQ